MKRKLSLALIICLAFIFAAQAATTLKLALLVPEGTNWATNLKKMAKEVEEQTKGEVKIKLYLGGSQGDESDILRKIRIGQLSGGVFTGKALGEINGDIRVMEIPFTFENDREKALKVLERMAPYFKKGLEKNKFKSLGFFEIGLVYYASQKTAPDFESLKGVKIWVWQGDTLVSTFIEKLKFVSVPLPLPDVLSSLSTGIIEAVYGPPTALVSLQWNTKVKYLLDVPLAYSIGALLVDSKSWSTISKANQDLIEKISEKYATLSNTTNNEQNIEANSVMKSMGIQFISFPEKEIAKIRNFRMSLVKDLKGRLFSAEAMEMLEKELARK